MFANVYSSSFSRNLELSEILTHTHTHPLSLSLSLCVAGSLLGDFAKAGAAAGAIYNLMEEEVQIEKNIENGKVPDDSFPGVIEFKVLDTWSRCVCAFVLFCPWYAFTSSLILMHARIHSLTQSCTHFLTHHDSSSRK
jgi:hypothetical protein